MTKKTYPDRGWPDHDPRLTITKRNAPTGIRASQKNKLNIQKHTRLLATQQHWRNGIADIGAYYSALFPSGKPNAEGRAIVRCPFHEDRKPSMGINFDHGGWICFANCGSGDLVSFVMKHRGVDFKQALRILRVKT